MSGIAVPRAGSGWIVWRDRLRRVHLWIGLAACLPAAILGLTGSILVFEPELDQLFHPALYQTTAGAPQPLARIVAAAEAAAPGLAPGLVALPARPGDPARVRLAPPRHAGHGRTAPVATSVLVYVDPASLAVLGRRDADAGFLRTISRLHQNLLTSDRSGRPVIGWIGVAMLTLAISGLALWWPRGKLWRHAFLVHRGARGRRLMRELHGAAGIWGFGVFIVVAISGIALAFPRSATALLGDAAAVPAVAPPANATPPDLDAVAARALSAAAPGQVRAIAWPAHPDQPFRVIVAPVGAAVGAPATTVFVDPWRGAVVAMHDPRRLADGAVMAWLHGLHRGAGLGWLWRIAVLAVGFLPTIFAATGFVMWLHDRRPRRIDPRLRAAPVVPNNVLTEE